MEKNKREIIVYPKKINLYEPIRNSRRVAVYARVSTLKYEQINS